MKDQSIVEIDTDDIQRYYDGNSVNFADIESFVNNTGHNKSPTNKPSKASHQSQVFYVSQSNYIEYEIAKRDALKKALKRKKINQSILLSLVWLLKTITGFFIFFFVCYGFYMLIWLLQQTFD